MLNNNWFTREINKVHDTKLALTMEAAGALSNSRRCPTLDRHLLEWVLEAQAMVAEDIRAPDGHSAGS